MLFTQSLKKNTDFKKVYNSGQSIANRLLVLYIFKNQGTVNRLGVSISRKVGKAVIRNCIKRRIKESYRLAEPGILIGYDLVVVARVSSGTLKREAAYGEINRALLYLLKKHNMLVKVS